MEKRTKSAVITLVIGLTLNIALGVSKLVTGMLTHASAITADALNNLSDSAVSIVTIAATALAARAADREHPFGHGRYEYIATFILGAMIVVVGIEALTSGIRRIITPVVVDYSAVLWSVLGVSIAVKAAMSVFYRLRGAKLKSDAIKAAATDSLADVIVTSTVLVCAVIESTTSVNLDGYVTLAVAVFIIVLALKILKNTIDMLLGKRPDEALSAQIYGILTGCAEIVSVHDLVINDYGVGNKIATVDAVLPSNLEFVRVHEICDTLEREVHKSVGVKLTIHADPLIENNEELSAVNARIAEVLQPLGLVCHDVYIDHENNAISFDICVDREVPIGADELIQRVKDSVAAASDFAVSIHLDYI